MIHTSFSSYVLVALLASGITVILLASSLRRPQPWYAYPSRDPVVGMAVKSGLVTAVLLTLFMATYRHAALARNATSAHMSVGYVLACGFVATFIVVTIAVVMFLAGRRL